jgi:hypothetical protein
VGNIYFELTEAFNAREVTVALASGQAVVYYRIATMSKDGDWIVRETPDCPDSRAGIDAPAGHAARPVPDANGWQGGTA